MFLHKSIVVCPNQDTPGKFTFINVKLNFMLTVVRSPPIELDRLRESDGNVRGR